VVEDARDWVDRHSFHDFDPRDRGSDVCTCGHPREFEAHRSPVHHTNLNWQPGSAGRKPRWPLLPLLGHAIMRKTHSGVLWGHVLWYQERANKPHEATRSWRAWMLWRAMQPTLGLLWKEAVASSGYRQEWVYASDGGHYENLGLVAALRDESIEHVVALDASGDKTDTWNTIGQAIALARTDANVEVDLDPTSMKASPDAPQGYVSRPFASGAFRRPAGRSGVPFDDAKTYLLVCKLGVWDKAPWDVRGYAATHKAFPCDSTGQQLYDGDEFEAYRSLGSAAVGAAQELPPPQPDGAGPAPVAVGRPGLEPATDGS
jgi:hypothetical protein